MFDQSGKCCIVVKSSKMLLLKDNVLVTKSGLSTEISHTCVM